MKKTVIASTLAVGLGVTGLATGNSADASEQNIDQANLAQQAQNNPEQLNESALQDGSYNYNFNQDGVNYNFTSDGENFSWSYGEGSGEGSTSSSAQNTDNSGQQSGQATQTEQASSEQSEQAQQSNQQPQQESAQQPQQETTTQSSASSNESSSNEASEGSSGVNAHLQQIAQRESGGDIHATNPSSGASGKFQFLQSTWDSVAPAEYQGQPAGNAPEDVQDAAAQKLYDEVGPSQWVTA
ncbi:transglycosylase family protein [Staphylococcus sp. mip270_02]|uniref:Transglycosylase n=1 Tax=Staphylococcus xylosus TaxID=1288 RepID=A0A418IJV8_STAXY|nr:MULTISPECIES: transglycosylase family protein [Staphylococcus]MBF0814395.1 transglycosylase family protein [Staphylococcus saprophyticus]MDW8543295.1 transglycosylase family protein [Staphylococcus sp. KG4-1]MRF36677.1 transglycosylase [Staphylococcus sp. KY49P]MDW8562715.1 transglycosylase family protein [Staphylococcus sp. KG4-3]PTI03891.1 transglycosylase [Staphylococcus xylosus]